MKLFALLFTVLALVSAAVGSKSAECELEHSVAGFCRGYFPMYTFKKDTNECIKFHYGGCNGNANRFYTSEDCENACIN